MDADLPVTEIPQAFLIGDAEHGFQMGAAGGGLRLAGALRQSRKHVGTGFRRSGDAGSFTQGGNAAQQCQKGFAAAGRAVQRRIVLRQGLRQRGQGRLYRMKIPQRAGVYFKRSAHGVQMFLL